MSKFAELPNGKRLRFPDDATPQEMQAAVRKELEKKAPAGVASLNLDMSSFADTVKEALDFTPVERAIKSIETASAESLEDVAECVDRLGKQMAVALRAMDESNKQSAQSLQKSINSLTLAIIKLTDTTLEAHTSIKKTFGVIEDGMRDTVLVTNELDKSVQKISEVTKALTLAIGNLRVVRSLPRRAVKNRDGSWTVEVEGRIQ